MRILFSVAVLAVCAGTASAQTFEFAAPVAYPRTNFFDDAVAIGDVTGDGLNDVVVASLGSSKVSVHFYVQRADGSLDWSTFSTTDGDRSNYAGLALGHFNADGLLDVVVGHTFGVTLLTSYARLNYLPARYESVMFGEDVEFIDIDLDGKLDAVAHGYIGDMTLFHGDGATAFDRTSTLGTGARGPNHLQAGDFNGDAIADLVLVSSKSPDVLLYQHSGTSAGFLPARALRLPVFGLGAAAIADFNGDGRNDVAVAQSGDGGGAIHLLEQDASEVLRVAYAMATASAARSLATTDLDGNGFSDLLVHHGYSGDLGYYLQDANGFSTEVLVPTPAGAVHNSRSMAVGDVNADGCADVALVDKQQGLIVRGTNCRGDRDAGHDFGADGTSDLVWRSQLGRERDLAVGRSHRCPGGHRSPVTGLAGRSHR